MVAFHTSNQGVTGKVKYVTIRRPELRPLLDRITVSPNWIFVVECKRRTDLYLTYPPRHRLQKHGGAVHVGDHSDVARRRFVSGGRRRIILQPAGTLRRMTVIHKTDATPTKHWQPTPWGRLRFDPLEHDLYMVYGMYPDQLQDLGTGRRYSRHGQHRTWCFICLRTTTRVQYGGVVYNVAA